MKKFLAVVTSMAMILSLLIACGSNAAPTETTTAVASEAASEKKIAGKEMEKSGLTAETAGADSVRLQSSILFCGSISLYSILSSLTSSFTGRYVTWDAVDSFFLDFNIPVYVAPGGSGMRVSTAIDDTADFDILARDIKDSEVEAPGGHYQGFVVAKDTLTVSVNVENPICGIMDDMPAETIRQVFAGEIATQDQVDSTLPAKTINVYICDLSGSAYEVFQKSVMGDSRVTAFATQSASTAELATNIAGNKWGIGYVGFGTYDKTSVDGQILAATKMGGVEATAENIISGTHTIRRPVMFVAGTEIIPSEQTFINYIFSQTGYDVVEASGYIPAFTPEAWLTLGKTPGKPSGEYSPEMKSNQWINS